MTRTPRTADSERGRNLDVQREHQAHDEPPPRTRRGRAPGPASVSFRAGDAGMVGEDAPEEVVTGVQTCVSKAPTLCAHLGFLGA